MSEAVVVRPGEGLRVGNVEFLALSEDTPRFNASIITVRPWASGPEMHVHTDEDDAFYVIEGELTIDTEEGGSPAPAGTFVLVPPGVRHTFSNRTGSPVRVLNIHAPAGFDRRLRSG